MKKAKPKGTPKVKVTPKKPKKVLKLSKEAEILQAALDILKMSNHPYAQEGQAYDTHEFHEVHEPLDLETHYAEMRETFCNTIRKLEDWYLLIDYDTYAVVCRRLNFNVEFSLNEDSMQPFMDKQKKTFCALRIFVWSDEAKNDGLVKKLHGLGAEIKDICVEADIKAALGVA